MEQQIPERKNAYQRVYKKKLIRMFIESCQEAFEDTYKGPAKYAARKECIKVFEDSLKEVFKK